MHNHISYFQVFGWIAAGFFGGLHCIGMCGGLAAALGLHSGNRRRVGLLMAANLGRISSYALIGALMGGVSASVNWLPSAAKVQTVLYLISLILIVLLALYLAQITSWLAHIERWSLPIWRFLQPRFQQLLPLASIKNAVFAGILWGWLPCGLVYTAAAAALASGSALQGSMIMLSFGAGTLPNLLMMGVAASQLQRLRQSRMARISIALVLIVYAIYEFIATLLHGL